MFYIEYVVDGFPGVQKAEPYSKEEVQYQRDDIAGFEGVSCVTIVSEEVNPVEEAMEDISEAFND